MTYLHDLKKAGRRILVAVLTLFVMLSVLPAETYAAHNNDGYPTDLANAVVLSVFYDGENSAFPGEPSTHTDTSKYTSFNSSFDIASGSERYASAANTLLKEDVLTGLVQGQTLNYIVTWQYVWGHFDTNGLPQYFSGGENNPVYDANNQKKMIKAILGEDTTDAEAEKYEIIWYVVKYQSQFSLFGNSSGEWHIDGILKEKSTFSINYYGNGNTSGSAPEGTANLPPNSEYTVEASGDLGREIADVDYTFTGWNTAPDGSGTAYEPGQAITVTENLSLYAMWQANTKYKATVNLYLDGAKTDLDKLHDGVDLYLSKDGTEYIPLAKEGTGTYAAEITENGTYSLYHKSGDNYTKAGDYSVTIYNNNGQLDMYHYSVNYNSNGGSLTGEDAAYKSVHYTGTDGTVITEEPVQAGKVFTGWNTKADGTGTAYQPGAAIKNITAKTTLYAQWEDSVNVKVNVVIDHIGGGGYDQMEGKSDLTVDFLEKKTSDNAYLETGHRLSFTPEGVTDTLNGTETTKDYTYATETGTGDAAGKVVETTYTANVATYEDLLASSNFDVAVQKSGYDVGTIEKTQDNDGNWTITIPLTYNPSNFNLGFTISVADSVPPALYPDAVIVKVEFWNKESNQWEVITQQEGTDDQVKPGVRVDIHPQSGMGSGSYPVWKYESDTENPYGYRINIWRFVYDGSTGENPDKNIDADNVVTYADGVYTATMGNVTDGNTYGGENGLKGAYYSDSTNGQVGTLDGVITIADLYDVTLHANHENAKVEGQSSVELPNCLVMPNLNAYEVTHSNENYIFEGWYTADGKPVNLDAGDRLTGNVELYAKWREPLKIEGEVTIYGTYVQDGKIVHVNPVDRADEAIVILETVDTQGSKDSKTISFTYDEATGNGTASYSFEVPNDGTEYEVVTQLLNYNAGYDNEPLDGTYEAIDTVPAANDAVDKNGNSIADVNVKLEFAPESYLQLMQIDASAIGSDYRPDGAKATISYRDMDSPHSFDMISQHDTAQGGNGGVDMEFNMGNANGSESIWKYHYDSSRYEYAMSIAALTVVKDNNNKEYLETVYSLTGSSAPFTIRYSNTTAWGIYEGKAIGGFDDTGLLKATLTPKEYTVTFDLNAGSDTITGMDEYKQTAEDGTVSYSTKHTWSKDTVIDAEPVREGYAFTGWSCETENAFNGSKVDAKVYSDITLKANWKSLYANYTVEHYKADEAGTYPETPTETETYSGEIGTDVSASSKTYDGYILNTQESNVTGTVTEGNQQLVLRLYYDADSNKDNVPDKYQKTVTFNVVNGSWNDGSGESVTQTVTLMKDDKWDADGTAALTAPEVGEKPADGFKAGAWDNEPPATVSGTAPESFTYTYARSTTPVVPGDTVNYIVEHYKADEAGTYPEEPTESEILGGKIGSDVTATPKEYEGYCVNPQAEGTVQSGTLTAITSDNDIVVLKLYYDADSNEDDVPDKYQKTVTFNVVNGNWNDGSNESITQTVTLMKDGEMSAEGTADLTAPAVGNKPNENYKAGAWDNEPPATVSGTEAATYTYTYAAKENYTITVKFEDESGNKIAEDSTTTAMEGTDYDVTDNILATITSDGKNYMKESQSGNSTGTADGNKTITAVYTLDNVGGGNNGDDPDGIPDKYQKTVTFNVVNGSWNDGSGESVTQTVTLMKDDKWDADGTAALTAPEVGEKPADGYKAGAWDKNPPAEITANSETTYTYTYAAKANYTITVKFEDESGNKIAEDSTTTAMEGTEYDVTNQILATITSDGKNYMKESQSGNSTGTADGDKEITVVYTLDNVGKGDNPDGIPDKYQKKVTFKVVNGAWDNDATEDVVTYATLMKDGEMSADGTAALTAPAVGNKPADGFKEGAWDNDPTEVVSGTADATYTYTYARSTTPVVPGDTVNYIVEHYKAGEDGTYPEEPTDSEKLGGKIGSTVTAAPKEYTGYCVNPQAEGTVQSGTLTAITSPENIVVLKLYYDADNNGDDVPDMYQKTVTFNVVNGNWNNGSSAAVTEVLTLVKDGKWDAEGSASLTAPGVGGSPNEGFQAGGWNVTPLPETVRGTAPESFTYTYARSTTPVVPGDTVNYMVEHYLANSDGTYSATPAETETLGGTIGSTVTASPKTFSGYCINKQAAGTVESGKLTAITKPEDIVVLKLYYDADNNGDGVPDKYQKTVTFKVVNGNWNDGEEADVSVTVTLMTDGVWDAAGSASLTAPAVGDSPDAGFQAGAWDVNPPAAVSGTGSEVYTYTYAAVPVEPEEPEEPSEPAAPSDPEAPAEEPSDKGVITGDDFNMMMYLFIALVAVAAAAAVIASTRRKQN